MMIRALWAAVALAAIAGCPAGAKETTGAPPSATTAAASASAEPSASASAEPEASAPEPETSASAKPTASGAPTGSAAAGKLDAKQLAEKWGCGGKGQKACPMQGWMKGAMPGAVQSGDKDKIAKALDTVASKPVAGFSQWSSIAATGAAKARAGDIEGAKASCKKCHSLYQEKYRQTMRNAPW